MNSRLKELIAKLEAHTLSPEERIEFENGLIDLALHKYISHILADEDTPLEIRITKIYRMIQYCSGENVPFPEEIGKSFYNSDEWKIKSSEIRKRDKFTCRICDKKEVRLNVHHILPKGIGGTESDENLITLCIECHRKMPYKVNTRFKIEELKDLQKEQILTKRQIEFLDIYRKKMGLISSVCQAANVSRTTFYKWLKKEEFRKAVEDADTFIKDFGEAALFKSVDNGDVPSIIFFNKTKNKDRGYGDKDINFIGKQQNNILITTEEARKAIESLKEYEQRIKVESD